MLTRLREQDMEPMFRWINDRDLVQLNAPYKPIAWADHERWFKQVCEADDMEIFAIRLTADDQLIGSCQLRRVDGGRCTLQIRIGERNAWGRGYGTEAVRLLVSHAFSRLKLNRVELEVFADNDRAIRAYVKAGFRQDDLRKEAATIDGHPVDAIAMAIERDTWADGA